MLWDSEGERESDPLTNLRGSGVWRMSNLIHAGKASVCLWFIPEERQPYLLAWHQIAFELAVPTWQHLQGSERKGSPDLSPRAPLCLTTGLRGDREWQTRTERGATSQRAQSFSPPAKCHSFRGYQQIVWIYLGLCQRKCASFTKATWVYFH